MPRYGAIDAVNGVGSQLQIVQTQHKQDSVQHSSSFVFTEKRWDNVLFYLALVPRYGAINSVDWAGSQLQVVSARHTRGSHGYRFTVSSPYNVPVVLSLLGEPGHFFFVT